MFKRSIDRERERGERERERERDSLKKRLQPGSHSHGTRRRISYGQNLTDDRGKSGWSWLIRIQYGYRTVLLRIITEDQGQFAKLVIIDSGMIWFNSIKRGMRES